MSIGCPSCGHALPPDAHGCGSCGLPLVGPAAAELWRVDQEIARLTQRRGQLLGWLRAGAAQPPPADPLPVDRGRPRSVQRLLLGLGVLLLVVAGLVFVAVSWRTLGVGGQVAVVGGAAVLACVASRLVERAGLVASAEAVAALGAGLVGVGLVAARTLGLELARRVDGITYAAVAAGLLAAVCALAGLRSARSAWGVVAVVSAVVAVPLGLVADAAGWFETALVLALAAAASAALRLVPTTWLRVRGPALVALVALVLATWLVAPAAAWTAASPQTPACAAVGLVTSVVVVLSGTRSGGPGRLWQGPPNLGTAAVFGAAAQLAAGVAVEPVTARLALAVLAGAVLVGAAWGAADWRRRWAGVAAAVAVGTAVAASADLVLHLRSVRRPGWGDLRALVPDDVWGAVLVTAVVATAACVVVGLRRPAWRSVASGTAAASVLVGTAVALAATTPAALVVGVAVLGVGFLVWAARCADPTAESIALLAAVVVEGSALAAAFAAYPGDPVPAAVALGTIGVAALAYGFRPARGWLWWVGAVLVPAAVWSMLVDREVATVEAFSLPFALTCALAGGLGWWRRRDLSSWAVAGPALVVALMPSALVSVNDESPQRPLIVLGASVVLLLIGVARRWQAPVVVAGIALVVVAVSQLAPWAYGLPRWLSLGTAGALLLAVGVRYEARRRNVVAAGRWLRALR